jgi:hypothetical protein
VLVALLPAELLDPVLELLLPALLPRTAASTELSLWCIGDENTTTRSFTSDLACLILQARFTPL